MLENDYERLIAAGEIQEKTVCGVTVRFYGRRLIDDEEEIIRRLYAKNVPDPKMSNIFEDNELSPVENIGRFSDGKWLLITDEKAEIYDCLGDLLLEYDECEKVKIHVWPGMNMREDDFILLGIGEECIILSRSAEMYAHWAAIVDNIVQIERRVYWQEL